MKKTPHGPTPEHLRLKSELDQARRELKKLKGAEAPAGGASTDEVAALRAQVAELNGVRQRLSKLYFGQVEEAKKRAEKLRRVMDVAARIGAEPDVEAILDATVAAIAASFGFATVVVRVREAGATRFRASAFAGVPEPERVRLAADDLSLETVRGWMREEARVGRSYLVRQGAAAAPSGEPSPNADWQWRDGDALLVPLLSRDDDPAALLWLERPADRLVPAGEVLELLEWFGAHTLAAVENARRQTDLRRRGREAEEAGQRLQDIHVLRSNFVSAVSHELRTPLTAIRAYVDTLLGVQEGQLGHGQLLHSSRSSARKANASPGWSNRSWT
jgi:K+-sensing histidine kinase KdpD